MAWALKIPALAWKDLPFLLEEINVISNDGAFGKCTLTREVA